MSGLTVFESRRGRLACSDEDIFNFVSDIRNFKQFIPSGSVTDFQSDSDSCSFQVSMLGTVKVRIAERIKSRRVLFSGNALQINDFNLDLHIDASGNTSEVRVILSAEMNPFLKMVAAEPAKLFLETLISEMEKFRDWKTIKTRNQPL